LASGASSALAGSSARHTSAWLRAVGDAAETRRRSSARAGGTGRTEAAAVRDAATGALQHDRAATVVEQQATRIVLEM
jgi:hypothetical protein